MQNTDSHDTQVFSTVSTPTRDNIFSVGENEMTENSSASTSACPATTKAECDNRTPDRAEQIMSASPAKAYTDVDIRLQKKWPDAYELFPVSEVPSMQDVSDEQILDTLASSNRLWLHNMTWNLHGKPPSSAFQEYLPPTNRFHILAFGTVECENTIAQSMVLTSKTRWERTLREAVGPNYDVVATRTLQAIHLMIFAHKSVLPIISDVQSDSVSCGVADTLGNKGGVAIGFNVGNTSLLFVNSHLAAHQHDIAGRNRHYARIEQNLRMAPSTLPDEEHTMYVSDRYDRVVWMGDLNYRINLSRDTVDEALSLNQYQKLMSHDQLLIERMNGNVLQGFGEGPFYFRPTYKYDANSDMYDTSVKRRVPSWTDRILFKPASKVMRLTTYNSLDAIKSSDHRPVYATFYVHLRRHYKRNEDIAEATRKALNSRPRETRQSFVSIRTPSCHASGDWSGNTSPGSISVDDDDDDDIPLRRTVSTTAAMIKTALDLSPESPKDSQCPHEVATPKALLVQNPDIAENNSSDKDTSLDKQTMDLVGKGTGIYGDNSTPKVQQTIHENLILDSLVDENVSEKAIGIVQSNKNHTSSNVPLKNHANLDNDKISNGSDKHRADADNINDMTGLDYTSSHTSQDDRHNLSIVISPTTNKDGSSAASEFCSSSRSIRISANASNTERDHTWVFHPSRSERRETPVAQKHRPVGHSESQVCSIQ